MQAVQNIYSNQICYSALAGAAIAKDVKVTANASGKIVAAAATEFYIGRTLAAAAADGDVVEIVIEKGFVPA